MCHPLGKVQSPGQRRAKNNNLPKFKWLEEERGDPGLSRAWKFDMPRKNCRTEKTLRQNVTAGAKRLVLFCAKELVFGPFSERMRHDLIASRAEVHEMVDVDWLLHGIEKFSQEDEIAAVHRAARSFFIHRFEDCQGIGLRRARWVAAELLFERCEWLVARRQ